jgi:S-adenosylmethionine hydrolase
VVDPGVGTNRRGIAIEVGGGQSYLVGPDNGLLAAAVGLVGGATDAVELTNPEYQLAAPGATFAGRDVFGPAAAHLCNGVPLHDLGTQVDPHSLTPGVIPLSRDEDGTIIGQVFWVDRYGNCQLNIDPDQVADWGDRVQLRWTQPRPGVRTAKRAKAFADLGDGEIGLVTDSYGLLTVALAQGSAADTLGLSTGDEVVLVPLEGAEPEGPDARSPVSTPVTLERKAT